MARLIPDFLTVNSTGHNIWYGGSTNTDDTYPFRAKNVGLETCYIGCVTVNGTDTVSTVTGYPLEPGEVIEGLPNATGGSTYCVGFNTASGTTQIRILGMGI